MDTQYVSTPDDSTQRKDSSLQAQNAVYDHVKELEKLGNLFDILHPDLQCQGKKKSNYLCIHQACRAQDSLFCNNEDCAQCSSLHPSTLCGQQLKIRKIEEQIRRQLTIRKECFLSLYRKQQFFIRKIRQDRKIEVEQYIKTYLDSLLQNKINSVFRKGQQCSITPAQVISLRNKLNNSSLDNKNIKLASRYETKLRELLIVCKNERKQILQQFGCKSKQINEPSAQSSLLSQSQLFKSSLKASNQPVAIKLQQQQILSNEDQNGDESQSSSTLRQEGRRLRQLHIFNFVQRLVQKKQTLAGSKIIQRLPTGLPFVQKCLTEVKHKPISITLLFRASEHKYQASAFHRLCDDTPDTLVLVRTQFNKILGGYTPLTWNSMYNGRYASEPTNSSFLFSLDHQTKMTLKTNSKAIKPHTAWGPIFGNGYDLAISDNCNNNQQSYFNCPWAYNTKSKLDSKNQRVWTKFCGATSGCHFRVVEYEVYHVRW